MGEALGNLQLQVMEEVWSRGNATVAEVHEELVRLRPIAYTTVLSTMRGLERRRFLEHTCEGKAHRFHARITREEYTQKSVHKLIQTLFAGRPEELMSHLLGSEKLNAETLQRVQKLIREEAGHE